MPANAPTDPTDTAVPLPFGVASTTPSIMRTIRRAIPTTIPTRAVASGHDTALVVLALLAAVLVVLIAPLATLGAQPRVQPGVQVDSAGVAAMRTDASSRRVDDRVELPAIARAHRVTEYNAQRLDRALRRVGRSYARLTRAEHARLRSSFEALLPERSLQTYAINDAQARAIVFIAFEDRADDGYGDDCDRYRDSRACRDDDRPRSCSASIERISRDAGWINQAVVPLRRASTANLGHDRELAVLEQVEERARQVAVAASRCACPAARDVAGDLLELARSATARHREGITSAWMTVGDDRLARIQQLARDVERQALRCGA